jgi:phosphoribosylformylglycinamidine cyclo-ligase
VVKDNLFTPPEIFKKIQEASKADNREMYQVFNMGCRMEIYTDSDFAEKVVSLASEFNIDAQIIGRVEASEKKKLVIEVDGEKLVF